MTRWILLGGVLLLLFAAALPLGYLAWRVESVPRYDPSTLEGIAQQRASDCGAAQPAISFNILERRETPRGTLVLFEASCFSVYHVIPVYGYLFGEQIGQAS